MSMLKFALKESYSKKERVKAKEERLKAYHEAVERARARRAKRHATVLGGLLGGLATGGVGGVMAGGVIGRARHSGREKYIRSKP